MKVIRILAGALSLAASAMPVEKPKATDSTVVSPAAPAKKKESPRRSRLAGASKTTLARAIEIALLKVPGEALRAEINLKDRKARIEVTVFAQGKIFEVEIDGETGKVLKVERDDDEDDDGEDDDRE